MRVRRLSISGFTLLEVLVALTIVGLGVVTLLQIFSLGLRLGARSTTSTEAVTYGARVMDELLARKKLSEGSDSGMVGTAGRWKSQVQTVRDASPSLNLSSNWELKEVALEMTVSEGERERRVDLKTFRLTKKAN
ncbi:MAG TPA: prepilin-type N-terminal cleavage/methylation domain-containing protein [Candidatus Binatia bacterium]|jgi:prepilin-type N-terminal cleavage/methylation domain-containing protein